MVSVVRCWKAEYQKCKHILENSKETGGAKVTMKLPC